MGGFNGSGTYVRYYNWTNDKANGIDITASRFDTEDGGFATGLSSCIVKDGQQTTTARIPFAVGLSFNAGTATTPGLSVISDTGTGFYQSATKQVDFTSNGTRTVTLNANGLDNTVVGGGTAAAGSFTTLSASSTLGVTGQATFTLAPVVSAFGTAGLVANDSSGNLSSTTALPSGTTATTQSAGDNSTKVATTAYVDNALLLNVQVFTTSGTYTPTSGMLYGVVKIVGGGGGGGGVSSSSSVGAPGASGGYGEVLLTKSQIGSSQTVIIGSGGTAGSSSGGNGGQGGTTSLGSLISCTGGNGGDGGSISNGLVGPTGGACTVSIGTTILNLTGQAGADSIYNSGLGAYSGAAGSNPLGYGAPMQLRSSNSSNIGLVGTGYGSGGGGAVNVGNSPAKAGSEGQQGVIIIYEYGS